MHKGTYIYTHILIISEAFCVLSFDAVHMLNKPVCNQNMHHMHYDNGNVIFTKSLPGQCNLIKERVVVSLLYIHDYICVTYIHTYYLW